MGAPDTVLDCTMDQKTVVVDLIVEHDGEVSLISRVFAFKVYAHPIGRKGSVPADDGLGLIVALLARLNAHWKGISCMGVSLILVPV